MAVDKFQDCFCGCGRKIKYCPPKELLPELNALHRQLEGSQRLSALRRIEQLETKYPRQSTLMWLKCSAAYELLNVELVAQSARQFVDRFPDNPEAHAFRALAEGMIGDWELCMSYLQNALERAKRVTTGPLRLAIFTAIQLAAEELHFVAASSLGEFLFRIEPEQKLIEFLRQIYATEVELPRKYAPPLPPPPENVVWREAALNAVNDRRRACWRKSATILGSLARQHPREAWLKLAVALDRICLGGDDERIAQHWRDYAATPGLSEQEVVEGWVFALAYTAPPDADVLATVRSARDIRDVDAWFERLLSSKRCVSFPPSPIGDDQDDEGPPAKARLLLLDRDRDTITEDVLGLPRPIGRLLLYGKQTDQPARLVALFDVDDRAEVEAMLAGLCPQDWNEQPTQEEVAFKAWRVVRHDERYLSGQSTSLRDKYLQVLDEDWYLHRLPNLKLAMFDGATLREAAANPRWRAQAQAIVVSLELRGVAIDLQPLRELLQLPALNIVVPDHAVMAPLVLAHLVDPSVLSDDQLASTLAAACGFRVQLAASKLGREFMRRPRSATWKGERVVGELAYLIDASEGLDYLDQLAQWQEENGKSAGDTLVDALVLALSSRNTERADALAGRIPKYAHEERVATRMQQIVMALEQRHQEIDAIRAAQAQQGTETSKLWTPDADAPIANASGGGESKLWLPGQ